MLRFIQLLVFIALLGNSAFATQRLIVRDTLGEVVLNSTCFLLGCNIIEGLGDPEGQVFLVGVPDAINLPAFVQQLLSANGIADAEADILGSLLQSTPAAPPSLYDSTPVLYYGTTVWEGYVTQPAAGIIGISNAQSNFGVSGAGIVAVIDTGVDPNQPVLQPVLVPGYDFTRNTPGGSEMADVNPAAPPALTLPPGFVNSYATANVDESTVSVVDNNQYCGFAHGTMVSGVIHLVAPQAQIMPLKAFQANGTGYNSDIIRAIYWGVLHGARVINMSFSAPQPSLEQSLALNFATSNGVILVAAAGNSSSSAPVYPAAYGNVIGVASTDNNDVQSTFSNYGPWVSLAAPGEGIVTTYPWATWAAAWGTSFSTPFVSGTVSLMLQMRRSLTQSQAAWALDNAQPAGPNLGHGRLAIGPALQAVYSMY